MFGFFLTVTCIFVSLTEKQTNVLNILLYKSVNKHKNILK